MWLNKSNSNHNVHRSTVPDLGLGVQAVGDGLQVLVEAQAVGSGAVQLDGAGGDLEVVLGQGPDARVLWGNKLYIGKNNYSLLRNIETSMYVLFTSTIYQLFIILTHLLNSGWTSTTQRQNNAHGSSVLIA